MDTSFQLGHTRSISDSVIQYKTLENMERYSDIPMSNPTKENNFPNTSLTSAIEQSFSAQDFILTGENHEHKNGEESFQWIVCADGHGSQLPYYSNSVIALLRKYDWNDFMQCSTAEEFTTTINDRLEEHNTYLSGATLSIVKIYSDHFDCYWVGDSEIRIYKDDEEVFRMNPHNHTNEAELQRIEEMGIDIRPTQNMKLLSEDRITMVDEGNYYYYTFSDGCNMTRSFGHNQGSKEFIEHVNVPRDNDGKYKVIVASDGLWDITEDFDEAVLKNRENEAQQLVEFASNRWHQSWNYEREDDGVLISSITHFEPGTKQIDDVCVATWIES